LLTAQSRSDAPNLLHAIHGTPYQRCSRAFALVKARSRLSAWNRCCPFVSPASCPGHAPSPIGAAAECTRSCDRARNECVQDQFGARVLSDRRTWPSWRTRSPAGLWLATYGALRVHADLRMSLHTGHACQYTSIAFGKRRTDGALVASVGTGDALDKRRR
jgi:hypothetical protein